MAINSVTIEEGCTSCGLCEQICPEVFEMPDLAKVKDGADLNANEEKIREAADSCPAGVIKIS
ncbi:MAG: ferredoxin [Candidatus Margulisbacteria bacterium]|nr:ferredoxin [Candidatus Margulisiibacteriota bacterium]